MNKYKMDHSKTHSTNSTLKILNITVITGKRHLTNVRNRPTDQELIEETDQALIKECSWLLINYPNQGSMCLHKG